MSIRLFVFDWDGTALGGHKPYDRFPPAFVRFLDNLARRGIAWATDTTWGVETQYKVIKASGVKSSPAFLAGESARSLGAIKNNKLQIDAAYKRHLNSLDRRFLEKFEPLMRRTMSQMITKGLADRVFFNPYGHHYISIYFKNKSFARKGWPLVKPLLKPGIMYRAFNFGNSKSDSLLPFYMNKGAILGYIQKRLGVLPEETLVAGDGFNDRHMFDPGIAKWMVCPANAGSYIKALVRKHGGIVSRLRYSRGIIRGAEELIKSAETCGRTRG